MSKLSKYFKSKGKSVSIPESAKSSPVPRTKEEIQKQYVEVCTALGDKQVKLKGIQSEIDNLFKYVDSFANELEARVKLDEAEKAKATIPETPTTGATPEPAA